MFSTGIKVERHVSRSRSSWFTAPLGSANGGPSLALAKERLHITKQLLVGELEVPDSPRALSGVCKLLFALEWHDVPLQRTLEPWQARRFILVQYFE